MYLDLLLFHCQVESIQDSVQDSLIKIRMQDYSDIPDAKMKEFKKRKLIATQ